MPINKKYELKRLFFHIFTSLILVWLVDYVNHTYLAIFLFIVLVLVDILRIKYKNFNNLLVNDKRSFVSKIIRREEKNNFTATTAFALGFLFISWMPVDFIKIILLINGLADPSARVFGIKWGRTKIFNTKNSWVGSFAFFLVAFFISVYYILPLPALAVALSGAIAEALPDKKPFWVDNLRIPLIVGVVLWVIKQLFVIYN
jgi:dolichol kinase